MIDLDHAPVRLAIATLAAAIGLGLYASPSRADVPGASGTTQTVDARQREVVPTMVVLDASGSMNTADAPGPRIAAAKRAVNGLVADLPTGARLGLEVYGTSTGSAAADKRAGCRDIRTVVPVGRVDPASFTAKVDSIRASGYTPIGESLRRAVAALPTDGARSIVLVSDGEDTCAPPQPCDVARHLHEQGVDLTVHTVGFKVHGRAREQLRCIARATGGSYQDAGDGSALSHTLRVQVSRALRGYRLAGKPVEGSDNAGDGPVLRPGQYVDTLDAVDASSHDRVTYYTIDPADGSTPYVSATVVPPARRVTGGGTLSAQVTVSPADDALCTVTGYGDDIGLSGTVSATTAVASPDSQTERDCLRHGPFVVKVTRSGTAFGDEPLPVELAYREEPRADSTGLAGAATEQTEAHVQAIGTSTPIDSGSSFNDAPLIDSGVYRDSFVSGEQRYVRVHLDWGQRLAFSLRPTKLPGLGILDGVGGQVAVANPTRDPVSLATTSSATGAFLGSTDEDLSGSTRVPVRYRNRESRDSGISDYSLDGDYYLVLSTKFTSVGEPALTVPYTLRVSVVGTAERGPVYGRTTTGAQTSRGATASGSDSTPRVRLDPSDGSSDVAARDNGGHVALLGTLAGAGALAVGAALWLGVARRRRSRATHEW